MESIEVPILFSVAAIVADVVVAVLLGEPSSVGFIVTAFFFTWATYLCIKYGYNL